MRSIAVGIFQTLSLLAFGAGVAHLFMAIVALRSYSFGNASAIQVTQVYSELTYTVLVAIAFFVCGAFIQMMIYFDDARRHQQSMEQQMDELIEAQAEA